MPFAKEFVDNLAKEIDLNKIDYIITNHAEIDHSGALPELMKYIPDTPIYCTSNGIKSIKGHYHEDWNFNPVKTGDKLPLGNGKELIFVEMKMLHWPDSMACYLTEDNIPIDIIATSHGVIWRKNPTQIVEKYLSWANAYQENQITIIYDTMWDGTKIMAENIAKGIHEVDEKINVKLFNLSKSDKNDVITEIFKSKIMLIGSPTINRGILTSVAGIIEEIKGLGLKNKKAAAFGCYGWSGESIKILTEQLDKSGFSIINEGIRVMWNPDKESLERCLDFGKKIAVIK